MGDTIRDDLAAAIHRSLVFHATFQSAAMLRQDASDAASAVLAVLGGLDPSADGALVADHLRNDAAEIARLRARVAELEEWVVTPAAVDSRDAEIARLADDVAVRDAIATELLRERGALADEIARLRGLLADIAAMHAGPYPPGLAGCFNCHNEWPCATHRKATEGTAP